MVKELRLVVALLLAALAGVLLGRWHELDKRRAVARERSRIWHELREREAGAEGRSERW